MNIREMTQSDIPAIHAMAKDEIAFQAKPGESGFWSIEQLENWVAASTDVLLVAEEDGEIAGFVLTALHQPTGKVTWENQLVLPKYRNRGVGKALIDEMLTRLKQKGATYIFFASRVAGDAVQHYERMGFERGEDFAWFDKQL